MFCLVTGTRGTSGFIYYGTEPGHQLAAPVRRFGNQVVNLFRHLRFNFHEPHSVLSISIAWPGYDDANARKEGGSGQRFFVSAARTRLRIDEPYGDSPECATSAFADTFRGDYPR